MAMMAQPTATKSKRSKMFKAAMVLGASACTCAFTTPDTSNTISQSSIASPSSSTSMSTSMTVPTSSTALSVLTDRDATTSSAMSPESSSSPPLPLPLLETPPSPFPAAYEQENFLETLATASVIGSSESTGSSFSMTTDGELELDPKREFELALGKAMDTLRNDYPYLLTNNPDFSIYHDDIEVIDPSGVTLHSIQSYKTSFEFIHMVVKLFYCAESSSLTFRLAYDCARKVIRISWNAELVPRQLYGGIMRNHLHVDGISVYEFDRESGLINRHRVEHLLVNDAPVQAPQGIFAAIATEATQGPEGIPVWNLKHLNDGRAGMKKTILEFQSWGKNSAQFTSLFASTDDDDSSPSNSLFDQAAFERKNAARKKFGLQPITPDEFIQIEEENKKLENAQRQKAEAASSQSSSAAEMTQSKPKKGKLLNKLFGNVLNDTCESNWDCQRPEVCCDFGFKKMCCKSGMGVFNGAPGSLQKIPVQVVADDHTYPRGGPGGDQYY